MTSRTPTQREALDRVLDDLKTQIHTSFPAKVLAYDADKQTVDVRPALLREVPSDDPIAPWGYEALPDIYAVQVMWPRAGNFIITFPISAGDWVLVTCAEQSTLNWRTKGEAPSHPGVSDPFGLNGLVAQAGWFPDKEKPTNVSTTKLVIGKPDGTALISLASDGTVVIGEGSGSPALIADATKVFTALAQLKAGVIAAGGSIVEPPLFPTVASAIALGKAKGF